jgi:ribosome biogenesis GTPase A
VDLVSRKDMEIALDTVAKQRRPEKDHVVFFTNRKKSTVRNLLATIKQVFSKYGKRESYAKNPILEKPYREAKGDIIIGVVGYPNVGKSSVINAISFKQKAKVSSKAGTTHGVHWINAGDGVKLIDTPGVIPLKYNEETSLGLIAARNPEKMKDPEFMAGRKAGKVSKIENFYEFKIKDETLKEANPYMIIEELALAKKHLKRGGVADDIRTAIRVIKDWQKGKLRL